jgi:hypothetical protein
MYGTIARLKVKPGALQAIKNMEMRKPEGFIRTIVYQMDKDASELMMVVLFKDKKSYFANANSPQQNEEYLALRSLLKADPDWFDGEIIYDTQ